MSGPIAPYEWSASIIELCIYYVRDKDGSSSSFRSSEFFEFVSCYASIPTIAYSATTMEELILIFTQEFGTFEKTRKVLAEMAPTISDYLDKLLMLK